MKALDETGLGAFRDWLLDKFADKQDKLVSGTSIKTVNGVSLLGSGNIDVSGGSGADVFLVTYGETSYDDIASAISDGKKLRLLIPADELGLNADLTCFPAIEYDYQINAIGFFVTIGNSFISTGVQGSTWDLYHRSPDTYTNQKAAELQAQINALGEPFRVKQWGSASLNVEIPCCTEDVSNTAIPKMTFSISDEEGEQYQIVGMIAYEVFDAASGGNRINCWPVCQFTGNGQKELSVRWMCAGTARKTARRISAWVLLKHR